MITEVLVEQILKNAFDDSATDIHLIPYTHGYVVQYRIQGRLFSVKKISPERGDRLISHLKFLAAMDISEKRKPQSGSLETNVSGKRIALRISTLPTAQLKESIVIRILPQKQTLSYDKLSLFPSQSNLLTTFMGQAHGMLVFSGPTGSGKTTMMYALAEYSASTLNRHVVTLEDPVERQTENLLQVQVNEKAGITYSNGLRAILRHDPDVILIGEIRDAETARVAIRAAMTGHLVLSSIHARSAEGVLYRLLELGIQPQEMEQTLLAITAQRLVTINCAYCGYACSKYCLKMRQARTGIFEILYGDSLKGSIALTQGKGGISNYAKLQDLIRKGIALGYISAEEYGRWIVEEKNDLKRTGYISHKM